MNYYTAMKIVCNCVYKQRSFKVKQHELSKKSYYMIAFLSPQDSQNCSILFGIYLRGTIFF